MLLSDVITPSPVTYMVHTFTTVGNSLVACVISQADDSTVSLAQADANIHPWGMCGQNPMHDPD